MALDLSLGTHLELVVRHADGLYMEASIEPVGCDALQVPADGRRDEDAQQEPQSQGGSTSAKACQAWTTRFLGPWMDVDGG